MEKANRERLLSLLKQHEQLLHGKQAHQEELPRQTAQFLEAFSSLAQSTIVPILGEIKDILVGKVESASIVRRQTAAGLRIKLDRWDELERSVVFFGDRSTQTIRISYEGIGFGLLSRKVALHEVTPDLVEEETLKFLRRLFRGEQPCRPMRRTETSNQRADRRAAVGRGARLSAAVNSRPALEAEISSLDRLGDAALWNAAQTRMPQPESERMEELHRKQRLTGLSKGEAQELSRLEQQYDRVILVRSHSAFLLKERGHDIQGLASGSERHRPKNGQARSATSGG
jgi:hypothetical protein